MLAAALRLALLAVLLSGCGLFRKPPPTPAAQPRYVVGAAYQTGGAWFYPREDFGLDTTGLAVVLPDHKGLTAYNEPFDGTAMAGSHDTLQLPAIVRVTNLETGLQALVQINDRGPARPGRLIGLTARAADRLGIAAGAVARVRVQVEGEPSQALRDQLQSGTATVASAPRGAVSSETLAPPAGIAQSTRGRSVDRPAAPGLAAPSVLPPAARLPETVVQVAADPGQLWIRAGEFGQARYAQAVQARLGGLGASVEQVRQGRSDTFRVRAGPFADVAQADSALDQARRAGVTDARIAVE